MLRFVCFFSNMSSLTIQPIYIIILYFIMYVKLLIQVPILKIKKS